MGSFAIAVSDRSLPKDAELIPRIISQIEETQWSIPVHAFGFQAKDLLKPYAWPDACACA